MGALEIQSVLYTKMDPTANTGSCFTFHSSYPSCRALVQVTVASKSVASSRVNSGGFPADGYL
jgi:hypothetical protein